MARRNDPDDLGKERKPVDRGLQKSREQEQEQEQEQEGAEKDPAAKDSQRAQNSIGNAAIANMIAGQEGGAGVEVEMAKRKADTEKEGQDFGGEGDPADAGPLTELDLTKSWNAGTGYPTDRPKFAGSMPDDELPPEDVAFLDAVAAEVGENAITGPPTVDAVLQPPVDVLPATLHGWATAISRVVDQGVHERAIAALATRSAPLLQDPSGRVLFARSRCAALGMFSLLGSPVLRGTLDGPTVAFLAWTLELGARSHRVHLVKNGVKPDELPSAVTLFERALPEPGGKVTPGKTSPAAHVSLVTTFDQLLALGDPELLIPDLPEGPPPEPDPDDPLGLDAVVAEKTGGAADPLDALFKSAIQAAERLAGATSTTRLRFAGVGVVIAEVSRLWTPQPPTETIVDALRELDAETQVGLQLLLDIARAAQRRTVTPRGLRIGLRRAAHALVAAREHGRERLCELSCGLLPNAPRLPAPTPALVDPLAEAFADGDPKSALPWLRSLPPNLERDAAIAFVELQTATDADAVAAVMSDLRARAQAANQVSIHGAATTCLLAALIRGNDHDHTLRVAAEQYELGRARRNGVVTADAVLVGIEAHLAAGRPERAVELRARAAATIWHMRARAGLSLLSRWTPPSAEEEA